MKYKIEINDEDNRKIIGLSEDEIVEIKYGITIMDKGDYANNRSFMELEIIGKIISNLKENKSLEDNIYDNNKKNLMELIEWAKSYMGKLDYRNVKININLGSEREINYEFTNMFVYDFSQEFSIERGIGIFNLKLRQKFSKESKFNVT